MREVMCQKRENSALRTRGGEKSEQPEVPKGLLVIDIKRLIRELAICRWKED